MNIDQMEDPSELFASGPRMWKDQELHPLSLGNRLLINMISLPDDPGTFFVFCVLFVLSHDRKAVQKLTRSRDEAREKILDWIDKLNLSEAEISDANMLVESIFKEANNDKAQPSGVSGNVMAPATSVG